MRRGAASPPQCVNPLSIASRPSFDCTGLMRLPLDLGRAVDADYDSHLVLTLPPFVSSRAHLLLSSFRILPLDPRLPLAGRALREPYTPSPHPPPPLGGGAPPPSANVPVVGRRNQQAEGGQETLSHATDAAMASSPPAPPFRPTAGLDARPSQASFAGSYGASARVGARHGVGEGVGSGAGAGGAATATPARRTATVKSVLSPGGDRLQQLAMAEIGFAEKELYAPKTGEKCRVWTGLSAVYFGCGGHPKGVVA